MPASPPCHPPRCSRSRARPTPGRTQQPRIDVTGLNSEITAILGNDTDLVTQLSDWCSIHYPSATTAAWSKSATIDWDAGIVVTSFAVSGDGGMQTTNVTVTYTSGTGQYEFGN